MGAGVGIWSPVARKPCSSAVYCTLMICPSGAVYVYSPCWTKTPLGWSSEKSFKKPCSLASMLFPVLYLVVQPMKFLSESRQNSLTMFCSYHHHPVLYCIPKSGSMLLWFVLASLPAHNLSVGFDVERKLWPKGKRIQWDTENGTEKHSVDLLA